MATWSALKGYIASNYKIAADLGDSLKLQFGLDEGRSQLVFISHYPLKHGEEDWILIESPFGELGRVDLGRAVTLVGDMVCGGIGLFQGKYLTLRDAAPLANLDINEFERPMQLITTSADRLEAILTGADRF